MSERLYQFVLDCCGRPPTAAARNAVGAARRAGARRVFVPYSAMKNARLTLNPPHGIGFDDGAEGLEFYEYV